MKIFLKKALALALSAVLAAGTVVTAQASPALGEDLTSHEVQIHQNTALSTNVFWSTSYSDFRTENIVTYTPNEAVTPVVTYGSELTSRNTISSAAKSLEAKGYRVVAGINGDFYNTSNGLPIGLVITEGQVRSSDAGYYAIGFRADGSAVLGKPQIKISADLGYQRTDSAGYATEVVRNVVGINKARVATGGIYLYTYDFNSRHTTGTTEAGVDVLCTIETGSLSVGGTVTVRAEAVRDGATVTSIGPNQLVLTANAKSDSYFTDALRGVQPGTELTLSLTSANSAWNEVEYAVGALYSLVENGKTVSGLAAGMNPRTAVGQRPDGTLVFYTIDGRKSGHSIGASMSQVASRLIELGCTTALCLDGGGSTTLTVTQPDATAAKTVNIPSDGGERAVSNQLFLVSNSQATGQLDHFYVSAEHSYVLAGSRVQITASAVDTNYIPMSADYELTTDAGYLEGSVLVTPSGGGDITVTAFSDDAQGSTVVHAIAAADDIAIRNSSNTILTSLTAAPGSSVSLHATAAYQHLSLAATASSFTWKVTGNIGTITQDGKFTAGTPGTGTITVTGGGRTASIPVTVSGVALHTVENFEAADLSGTFSDTGSGISISRATDSDHVKLGRSAGKLTYRLDGSGTASASGNYAISETYTGLNLWVYGDGSGSTLSVLTSNGTAESETAVGKLDFTGWKQLSVTLPSGTTALTGLRITGQGEVTVDPDTLEETVTYPHASGAIWVDQIVATYGGKVDQTVPAVKASVSGSQLTGSVQDGVDGVLPRSAVTVTCNGKSVDFSYNSNTGAVSAAVPSSSGAAQRVTITAKDASGNIGRASCDVPASASYTSAFTDTKNYWAATYVDFLYDTGITTGYADKTFRPGKNITRQEFAVMLYRYLGLKDSGSQSGEVPFADWASVGAYARTAVKALYQAGIINGTTGSDGKLYFQPNSSLTRAQAAAMIGRTQEKGYTAAELSFTDAASIPAYAQFYVRTMAAQGVIGGYADGSFKPGDNITRGQMAKILYNLL